MLCCKLFLSKAPASGKVSFTLNSIPTIDLSIWNSTKNSVLSLKWYLKVPSRNLVQDLKCTKCIPISRLLYHTSYIRLSSPFPHQKDTPAGSHLFSLLWEFCGWQGVETGTSGRHWNWALGVGVARGVHIHVKILQQLYLLYRVTSHHIISYHVISYLQL